MYFIKYIFAKMNIAYILLGGNVGKVKEQMDTASKLIRKAIGNVLRKSADYKTAAWGKKDQPDFLNRVLIIETKLNAAELLKHCLSIENQMGRKRTLKNAPRIIDIDILFFNKEIINENNLQIPHPFIQQRRFTLVPLNELSPGLKHPQNHKTIHQLLLDCEDTLAVKKIKT